MNKQQKQQNITRITLKNKHKDYGKIKKLFHDIAIMWDKSNEITGEETKDLGFSIDVVFTLNDNLLQILKQSGIPFEEFK